MSPRAAAEFSKEWPALQSRLKTFLRCKGVGAGEIDDLVQEVATRLLSFWHKLDRDKPVWPLASTIALNLLRDRRRRPEREVLGDLPDLPTSIDAAQAGIARMELAEVLRAMDDLTPAQRSALLQAIEPEEESSRSTSAEKMLRMRARRRLANAVGRACAGVGLKFRRAGDAVHAFFTKTDAVAQALACATCLFVTTAGAASMYPETGGLGIDGGPRSVAATESSDVTVLQVHGTPASFSSDEGMLSPDRSGSLDGAEAAEARSRTRDGRAHPEGAEETAAPTVAGPNVPLPGTPEVPGGGDAPIPAPAPPDAPEPPSGSPNVDSGGSVPEGSPLQEPSDEPVDVVETVTETLDKATR